MFWLHWPSYVAHMLGTCATPKEKLLKLLLVRMIYQCLCNRPNVALQNLILDSGEGAPQRSHNFVFHWEINCGKTYKISKRKLQVIKKENYKCLFWDSRELYRWKSGQRAITLFRWRYDRDVLRNSFSRGSKDFLREEGLRVKTSWI